MPTDTDAEATGSLLVDTSAAIPYVLEDHDDHARVIEHVRGRRLGLAGHAWFESYAVLTRLPGGQRRRPADVALLLSDNFPESAFLDEVAARDLGPELAGLNVSGGSVYDALVAAAARHHHRPLLTLDLRARATYEALGIQTEYLP